MEDNKDTQVVEEKVEQETTQKTYTVQDIDNSFNAGMKKAYADIQKDEDYKQYQEWKKTTQNDSERIKELETMLKSKDDEISQYKVKEQDALLEKAEIKPEFTKFVKAEVSSLVNDETTFEDALTKFKEENSQYFGKPQVTRVQSSPTLVGGTKPQTTNEK